MQCHTHLYALRPPFIYHLPQIPKESSLSGSSSHVSPSFYGLRRIVALSQAMSYGGGVHVHLSRPLHRFYSLQMPDSPGLKTLWTRWEISGTLKRRGSCHWQERTSYS